MSASTVQPGFIMDEKIKLRTTTVTETSEFDGFAFTHTLYQPISCNYKILIRRVQSETESGEAADPEEKSFEQKKKVTTRLFLNITRIETGSRYVRLL
jgi:hypothetical protein